MSETIRCAPSAPNAAVAIFSASVVLVAFSIASTVSFNAFCGFLPFLAASRKNLFNAGPTLVKLTPPCSICPNKAAVSSAVKLAFANIGPNVSICESNLSIGTPVAWLILSRSPNTSSLSPADMPNWVS